ncbi:MAG: adenylosuccinate synthase [Christensenellaceae bacterium]|nr:adenylosuccinate synthase [Christensenellaceae bacterium]
MLTAIVGINWGDEGKGRMVDLLSEDYDVIVRYQGGNNAGHTVINDKGKFILNLLPSGILRDDKVNVMGPGMVIDVEHLFGEIGRLREAGIEITPDRLKISDKATICMPYHKLLDCLEEDRLADKKFGSTRRGIAPSYADKYYKKSFRMGDLLHPEVLHEKVRDIVEWKNLTVANGYGHDPISVIDIENWLEKYGMPFKDYVCNTTDYLSVSNIGEKRIMFEAQLGALRDIDFGIFPYTSSSSTIAAYAPIGAGIPMKKLDNIIGIIKAYSSCVGEGPFVCEMFGPEGDALRDAGQEYGAATGRPRRVGGFDVPASKYGVKVQGATELALTKLDVLSGFEKIPVCVAYKVNGKITTDFPIGPDLDAAEPVIEYMDGWMTDISQCRTVNELPRKTMEYVDYIASQVNCQITYISVGPDRDQYIKCV